MILSYAGKVTVVCLTCAILLGCGPTEDAIYEDVTTGQRVKVVIVDEAQFIRGVHEGVNERLGGTLFDVRDLSDSPDQSCAGYQAANAPALRQRALVILPVDDFAAKHKCVHGCAILESLLR